MAELAARIALYLAAIFGPPILLAIYLEASRQGNWANRGGLDCVAMIASVFFGAWCLWAAMGDVANWAKGIWATAYVLIATSAMLVFGLVYVCDRFGDCL